MLKRFEHRRGCPRFLEPQNIANADITVLKALLDQVTISCTMVSSPVQLRHGDTYRERMDNGNE